MPKVIEGKLIGESQKFAIVVSRFNEFITSKLLGGCIDTLTRHGVSSDDINIIWAPGAYEIPIIAQKLVTKDYDGVICLGAVIRGSTPHFEYVSSEVTKGVAQVGLQFGKPVIFGVLTVDTIEQAIERAGTKSGNKGSEAAMSAIEMVNLFKEIDNL